MIAGKKSELPTANAMYGCPKCGPLPGEWKPIESHIRLCCLDYATTLLGDHDLWKQRCELGNANCLVPKETPTISMDHSMKRRSTRASNSELNKNLASAPSSSGEVVPASIDHSSDPPASTLISNASNQDMNGASEKASVEGSMTAQKTNAVDLSLLDSTHKEAGVEKDIESYDEKTEGRKRLHEAGDKEAGFDAKKQRFERNISLGMGIPDNLTILSWNSPMDHVPMASESAMLDLLLEKGADEREMMKNHPALRRKKIVKELQNTKGLSLLQALSLRRRHMKLLNSELSISDLGLGGEADVQKSSELFREAVEEYLRQCNIKFLNEKAQKEMMGEGEESGTPDFEMIEPILLRRVRGESCQVMEEREINWIEAKMFYGASTIPPGSPGALGEVRNQAQKYVDTFGEGAIVFMLGCGEQLAADLAAIGVTALDCSGAVSLEKVHQHQRSWCGDQLGEIWN